MTKQKKSTKSAKMGKKGKAKGAGQRKGLSIASASVGKFKRTYFKTAAGSIDGSVRIMGRELVQELATSSGFLLPLNHSVNPANPYLFPRLSSVANAFEQFSFKGFQVCYEAGCPSSTAGTVLMYHDYDPVSSASANAVRVLANETSVEAPVWSGCSLRSDCSKQMISKLYVGADIAATTLTAAEARQSFFGILRVYMDKGPSTSVFAGYVYVEYDVELYTPIPPGPVSLTGNGPLSIAYSAGANVTQPLQTILSAEGISGTAATNVTSAYTNAGGKVGLIDTAKSVYEAGSYIADLWSTWSMAALDQRLVDQFSRLATECKELDGQWYGPELGRQQPLRRGRRVFKGTPVPFKTQYSCVEECTVGPNPPPPPGSLGRPTLSSGDLQYNFYIYDVSNGVIDPDFPVTATGMTFVASYANTFSGVGAYASGLGYTAPIITVPAGSRYMIRPFVSLGPTTGRTCVSGLLLTTNVVALEAIGEIIE